MIMNIFVNMVIGNGVQYWGKKVNEVCTRKVGDPAEVYTHNLLPSNLPINIFCATHCSC